VNSYFIATERVEDGMNELSCLLHKDRENILAFCEKYKDIYLYGCGHVGMMMKRYLEEENI